MSKISSTYPRTCMKQHLPLKMVSEGGKYLGPRQSRSDYKKSLLNYPLRKSMSNFDDEMLTGKSLFLSSARRQLERSNSIEKVESEYIKNLQKQIYFLELETTFLREQSKKANDVPSKFAVEAEQMMMKVKRLQESHEGIKRELSDKNTLISDLRSEKDCILDKYIINEEKFKSEKQKWNDINVDNKKLIQKYQDEHRDVQNDISSHKDELSRKFEKLINSKKNIESELTKKTIAIRKCEVAVQDKERTIVELEKKLNFETTYENTKKENDKKMKVDIIQLRQRAKEAELMVSAEKCLNEKMIENSKSLVLENSELYQKILELQSNHERELCEKNVNDNSIVKRDLDNLRDVEVSLRSQLEQVNLELMDEQTTAEQLVNKYSKIEDDKVKTNRKHAYLMDKISALEKSNDTMTSEMRRVTTDKQTLETQLSNSTGIVCKANLAPDIIRLKDKLDTIKQQKDSIESLTKRAGHQDNQWREFGQLAERMQSLTASLSTAPDT